jgi:hypothetical protein
MTVASISDADGTTAGGGRLPACFSGRRRSSLFF